MGGVIKLTLGTTKRNVITTSELLLSLCKTIVVTIVLSMKQDSHNMGGPHKALTV